MKKIIFALCTLVLAQSSAFAIDQVILTNGDIVEGKILSDVPNRHVDLQLLNGNKRRFQRTEVSSVERDVPSNKDTEAYGSESRTFFGLNAGGYNGLSNSTDVVFNFGARFGANVTQMGDFAKFAFGLSYSRTAQTQSGTSAAINEILVQFLFRKVANSGFYIGPELGVAILTASISGFGSGSATEFDFGGVMGYDYYFNPSFSMGPEVHINSINSNAIIKYLLGATLHFN